MTDPRHRPPKIIQIDAGDGIIRVGWGTLLSQQFSPPIGWSGGFWPFHPKDVQFEHDLRRDTTLGFRYERQRRQSPILTIDSYLVSFPYWLPSTCFAGLPLTVAYLSHKRRRRENKDNVRVCPVCSYDLRATPDRCPECGTVQTKVKT